MPYGTCFPKYAYLPPPCSSQSKVKINLKRIYDDFPDLCCAGRKPDHVSVCPRHFSPEHPRSHRARRKWPRAPIKPKKPSSNISIRNWSTRRSNACNDFYKYSCNKWLSANPIPADQVFWSTGSGLELWNEGILRETLEAASKNDSSRSPVQQKIGDYWAACMDESGIEAAGLKPLQPELDRIAAMKSKADLTLEIAHLHHLYPGAWESGDNQSNSPLFGFTGQQDYDNASMVVAQLDQGGLSLPNRDYYLNKDDKSKALLTKYLAHVQKMFVLAGESESQATRRRRDRPRT